LMWRWALLSSAAAPPFWGRLLYEPLFWVSPYLAA
jgi:hypothetical protein